MTEQHHGQADDDHHHDEHSHLLHHATSLSLAENVPFYAKPMQRQRWDEEQILPHVNWGDLYWDLFYVSGAFNLAAALKESLNGIGVLYFFACFLPILLIWTDKSGLDSRYVIADNLSWRAIELVKYCILGTAIQHIRPVEVMSHTGENLTMFTFCVALAANHVVQFMQDYDIMKNCEGGPEATVNAQNDIAVRLPSFLLTMAAGSWCLFDYVIRNDNDGDDHTTANHWPAILVLLSFFTSQVASIVVRFALVTQQQRSHKESFVPYNIDHTVHRLGEWMNLMLGESILALLIVEQSEGARYYVTFYSGIMTVTMFQYLYFRSSPLEADDHAFRRSSEGAFVFYYSMIGYSAALIMVGCSFKMILHFYLEQEEVHDGKEAMDEKELEETSRAIANLYSWSSAASFFCLDCMLMSHRGFAANFGRLAQLKGQGLILPSILSMTDIGLTVFQACLSLWVQDLETITVIGLFVVLGHVLIRTRGLRYFPVSKRQFESFEE